MAERASRLSPRNYFLNESHELARGEKEGGGRLPTFAPIDWKKRGHDISHSLSSARKKISQSSDPLRDRHLFLSANPVAVIKKQSANRRRAPSGELDERPDYAGDHSRVFRRLGLDLLAVDAKGTAVVHATPARADQLIKTAQHLDEEGRREQARWVSIESFDVVPLAFRADDRWLSSLDLTSPSDAVIELQPLLSRIEIEQVIRAILEILEKSNLGGRLSRTGTDFSGRHWYRGMLPAKGLRSIATQISSVQALHPPFQTPITLAGRLRPSGRTDPLQATLSPAEISRLPVVAVVDVGVPSGHLQLSPYRRGSYTSPDAPSGLNPSHASRVASRVVFGDPDIAEEDAPATGSCAFYDVNIAVDVENVDDKALIPALQAVVSTSPDVRVFNLSIGQYEPLATLAPIERRERLASVQDLDNFAFRNDVLIVVAAGNSYRGVRPTPDYPSHLDDPRWALGSWACGYNTIKCGSYVGRLSPSGLVDHLGWPSAFTRIGPGISQAPSPDFSANGGNSNPQYDYGPGLGVWAYNEVGRWEDASGTSFAAPLLARQAAFALDALDRYCEQGARPFACTTKAFLALSALPPASDVTESVKRLISRTLGYGTASAQSLLRPSSDEAVLIWQGVLAGPEQLARIRIPIPRAWVAAARRPTLRVIAAWESPVNQAVESRWACRRVEYQLRRAPGTRAISHTGRGHKSYPFLDRTFALPVGTESGSSSDNWLLELSYKEIAEYPPALEFSPHQRVALAMRLSDADEDPVSPQEALLALPEAVTMTRLSIPENRIPNPVVVKIRV